MIEINNTNLNIINKQFQQFRKDALKGRKPTTAFVVSQLQRYEKTYKRAGFLENFVEKSQQLAEDFNKIGLTDFTGIIYAALIKIKTLPDEVRELLIKRAIQIAQKQNDSVHELGRVVDLKILYKNNLNEHKKEYIKTLFLEEKLLRNVLRNFEESAENFKTVSKHMQSKEEFYYRFALTKTEIAKQHSDTNKKIALKKLIEAKKIFKNLGKIKEEYYTQGLIDNLKHQGLLPKNPKSLL